MPALIVMLCLLPLCFFAVPLLAQNAAADNEPLRLAVVNQDSDPRLEKLLHFATGGGLFDELLHIRYETDVEQARVLLQNGDTDGVFILPQNFLQAFLSGTNLSARLLTNHTAPVESLALSQLVLAAEEMLETGQGGVWAVLSLPQVQALSSEDYGALYRDVNFSLLRACLEAPAAYLSQEEIPLSGTLMPLGAHYFTVFYIFFALLSGCFFSHFFTADKKTGLLRRLASLGVKPVSFLLPKLLLFFFYQLILGAAAFCTAGGLFSIVFSLQSLMGLICFALLTAALCLLLFSALDIRGAVLSLVLLGFAGLFCTGGFLPPSYLPAALVMLGAFLPAGLSYRLLAPLCGVTVSPWLLLFSVIISCILFVTAAFFIAHMKREGQ